MDEDKIKCFLTLAETLSFTKTAAILHKSQSVISRQILSMEEELGFQLFVRDSRFCSLTPGGEYLVNGLSQLVSEYKVLIKNAEAIQSGTSGVLNIGMMSGDIMEHYHALFHSFYSAFPEIEVNFIDFDVTNMDYKLRHGEIDLAIDITSSKWFRANRHKFRYIISGTRHDCIYIPKTHRFAGRDARTLSMKDFAEDTFLIFDIAEPDINNSPSFSYLRSFGIEPKCRLCPSLSSLVMMLEAGLGVTISSDHLVLTASPNFEKLFIPEVDNARNDAFLWLTDNVNPCIKIFTHFLNQYISKHPSMVTEDPYYTISENDI